MSHQPTDRPGDWRRQRRPAPRPGTAEEGGPGGEPVEPSPESAEEVVLSRTLFSFLEPSLDIISSFGAPLVIAGVVAVVSGVALVAFVSSMRLYGYIDIAIGVGLIGLVAVISLSTVVAAFFSRTGRYGINSLIMMAAFTGIIFVVGIIGFENNRRIDLTATNQFSLNDTTKDLLKNLEEPVRTTAFYKSNPAGDPTRRVRQAKVEATLKEFAARTGKFTYRVVDPDLKPEIANKYFGARPVDFIAESVVVEGLESEEFDVINPRDQSYSQLEQDLVTSILVATGKERKAIYFLTGHGERSLDITSPDGYSQLRSGLENDNYEVRTLRWDPSAERVDVPEENPGQECAAEGRECLPTAALLVIARPTTELPQVHAEALDLYLRGKKLDSDGNVVDRREGARLMFLAEADTHDSFRNFLARWGVVTLDGYIRDLRRSVPGNPHILRLSDYNYEQAPIEIIFPRGEPLEVTFMPGATALALVNDNLRIPLPLAATSPESYLIGDPERTEPITDAGDQSDRQGPFLPAVLVRGVGPVGEPPPTAGPSEADFSWLVVFGDSDFVANSFYERGGGADLYLNSTNYLLGDFSLTSIRDKAFTFREFNLNRNEYNFVRFSSWFFLPGLLGLMAALVWWVRR